MTLPDKKHIKGIPADNELHVQVPSCHNYVVTGSKDHHKAVGSKIVQHIEQGPSSILQHIKGTKIAKTFLST